jgi:nucleotide-binding universal stress UspA family protein
MEWQPSTIAVGIDGSEGSTRASEIAVAIARARDAKLLLVTVVRPPEGWWGIGGAPPTPEALSTALVEGQQRTLGEAVAHLDLDGVEYETVEELGDPSSKLIEVAETRDVDVIIIGRRGAGLAERMVIGSVADRLCHHSPVPVLVVP